jgi:hypothetical protein
MNDKPLASLSPTLLARKGGAKPAMRSQLHYPDSLARTVTEDDLGWNDMGQELASEAAPEPFEPELPAAEPEQRSGDVVPLKAAAISILESDIPDVVRQRQVLAERTAPAPAQRSASERRSALESGRRAAFTLRVDADRHLKLRLACTIRNRSAQQLVTEALDRLIDELPDLATLAAQVAQRR